MSLLGIRNLDLSIHGVPILHDVGLTVDPGEIVAITGESGSGKSMTALAVMGLTPEGTVTRGEVKLGGTDILTASEGTLCGMRGRDMGMVFQEPMMALNPVQTIGAQVSESIVLHGGAGKAEAMERARELLDRVGLNLPAGRYPHELSGGQRQRVVIAMAIAMRPKLLIADEPTTALDVTTQARILDLLRDLVGDMKMGLLMITHDLAVVSQMADRIAVMQKGRIVETGETHALFREMNHPYTRALFEASKRKVDLPQPRVEAPLLKLDGVYRDYPVGRHVLFGSPQDIPGAREHFIRSSARRKSGTRRRERQWQVHADARHTRAGGGAERLDRTGGQPVFTGHSANLAVRRRMQVVFQDPYGSFNPRHRVGRLITEPFHLVSDPPAGRDREKAIARALTDVGLQPEDARKYIHEFSGGQRQRIAIARALIVEPDLIVFDEAVSALDVSVRAHVLDLLADLCRKRTFTYLFISHDLSVVRSVTDRILVMQAGRIVEQGPTERVFNDPQHTYTQSLIAALPTLPDPNPSKTEGARA